MGQCQGAASSQTGWTANALLGFADQWLHIPAAASLDAAVLYLHCEVLPFACCLS